MRAIVEGTSDEPGNVVEMTVLRAAPLEAGRVVAGFVEVPGEPGVVWAEVDVRAVTVEQCSTWSGRITMAARAPAVDPVVVECLDALVLGIVGGGHAGGQERCYQQRGNQESTHRSLRCSHRARAVVGSCQRVPGRRRLTGARLGVRIHRRPRGVRCARRGGLGMRVGEGGRHLRRPIAGAMAGPARRQARAQAPAVRSRHAGDRRRARRAARGRGAAARVSCCTRH